MTDVPRPPNAATITNSARRIRLEYRRQYHGEGEFMLTCDGEIVGILGMVPEADVEAWARFILDGAARG